MLTNLKIFLSKFDENLTHCIYSLSQNYLESLLFNYHYGYANVLYYRTAKSSVIH